jgi:ribose transport system permease protein
LSSFADLRSASEELERSVLGHRPPELPDSSSDRISSKWKIFGFRKIGGIYVLIAICGIFSLWAPSTFPHWATAQQVLNGNSINALFALTLIIPLSAGVFDLSGAYTMSLTGVVVSYLIVNTNASLELAIAGGMGVAIGIGVINGVVVVGMRIDSLIGTLATGSLIQAAITMVTNDSTINGARLSGSFSKIAQTEVAGLTLPVLYVVVLAVILWFVLEHTPTGRRIYATGFNKDAARLANIRTERIRFVSLVLSSTLAGAAGIVLASTLGSGGPTSGNAYLLPGFAAVFLGATQFKAGRFNAWGTILAVLLLGVGVVGLGLANAPSWCGSMFTGVVLISALAVTGTQRRQGAGLSGLLRRLRRSPGAQQPEMVNNNNNNGRESVE